MSFALRLREAMSLLGWNATDLSCCSGLAISTVSHLVNSVTIPKLVTALTISEITGWTIDSLNSSAPLGATDFDRLPYPAHLVSTEWSTSVAALCKFHTAREVSRRVGQETPTVRKYYLNAIEPALRIAVRWSVGLEQTLQSLALGKPVLVRPS
jgi:hypothetical protein